MVPHCYQNIGDLSNVLCQDNILNISASRLKPARFIGIPKCWSQVCCPNLWYAYANPVCNINTFASCWTVSSNLHLLNFGTQHLPNTTHWTVNQEHADIYKMYLKSVNMTYYSPSLNTTITLAARAKHQPDGSWRGSAPLQGTRSISQLWRKG